jgi:hypothetical protein
VIQPRLGDAPGGEPPRTGAGTAAPRTEGAPARPPAIPLRPAEPR